MHIEDGLLTPFWLALGWVLVLPALMLAARNVRWQLLRERSTVFGLAALFVLALWSVRAGIYPGLNVHLLGGMLLTLMFGPWPAMLVLAGLVALLAGFGVGGWWSLGVNLLALAVVPVLAAYGILRVVEKHLPSHFFIYIFVVAFIGSALTIAAMSAVVTFFLLISNAYTLHFLIDNWLISMILDAWGEALTTGMLITLMVVYRPYLVSTFDDNRYLKGK